MKKRHLLTFESKHHPLVSRKVFAGRVFRSFGVSTALIFVSLGAGMMGYAATEGMSMIDAFANASMILSGMGPLDPPKTFNGKFFAGMYALYSGLVLILAAGVVLAPLVHRMVHRFHLEEDPAE